MNAPRRTRKAPRSVPARPPAAGVPQTLPRLDRVPPPTRFDALRADGIRRAQDLSGHRWTDYNLHDPGITILEAACYALTDLAFRADFPVADRLSDADDRIDWAAQALYLPQDVFPCRATTLTDYRRLLLDRLPQLDGVSLSVLPSAASGPQVPGLVAMVLDGPTPEADPTLESEARRLYAAARNLGEDLGTVVRVRKWPCRLLGDIEIGGARDPADIVAEVHDRCASYLAAVVDFEGCAAALKRDETLDRILDGPWVENGFARGAMLERATQTTLFVTDLIARIRGIDGVSDVHWLAVQPEGDKAWATSLNWRSADGHEALALLPPGGDGPVTGLTVRRRGSDVTVLAPEVRRRCEDRLAARRARRAGLRDIDIACPPPRGRRRGAPPAVSLQAHFPATYGLADGAAPQRTTERERARIAQLRGYLLLFDQVIAHAGAQLDHLGDLFSIERGPAATYAWHALTDGDGPGMAELRLTTPSALEQVLGQTFDDRAERKSRLLDHLLALHGQTYAQNSLRQFTSHLSPGEQALMLLHNKADLVRNLVGLSANRNAGFDDTRPSWNQPGNRSGLQQMVSLLLGFPVDHSRPLAAGLQQRELVSADQFTAAERAAGDAGPAASLLVDDVALQRLDLGATDGLAGPPAVRTALPGSALANRRRLPRSLWWCAMRHDAWSTTPGAGSRVRLVLGPDEERRHWVLGEFDDRDQALDEAWRLRRFVTGLDAACEGLHVVEHVLLRPLRPGAGAGAGAPAAAFYRLQLSVVFPDWTQRCHQPGFQRLAEETVSINCPAHLRPRCLWLAPAAMAAFETAYVAWLDARMALARRPDDPALRAATDEAAAALAGRLN